MPSGPPSSGMPPSGPSLTQADAVKALLAWYQAMGVDEIVGAVPQKRYGAAPARSPAQTGAQSAAPASKAATRTAPQAPDAVQTAQSIAQGCDSLEDLRAAMDAFDLCPLKKSASRLVFADGAPDAPLMLIGEAPGQEEDRQGKPFVGRSGQLLDRMLGAIGLDRTNSYIANILPWRPPLNRKPDLTEIQMCLPFLRRHIELVAPRVIVALGGTAAQHLLDTEQPMRALRGRWRTLTTGGHQADIIATYHPAYLLRTPIAKRAAWQDMLALSIRLQDGPP